MLDNPVEVRRILFAALNLKLEEDVVERKPHLMSFFSGDLRLKGGKVGFEGWKYDVDGLSKD